MRINFNRGLFVGTKHNMKTQSAVNVLTRVALFKGNSYYYREMDDIDMIYMFLCQYNTDLGHTRCAPLATCLPVYNKVHRGQCEYFVATDRYN